MGFYVGQRVVCITEWEEPRYHDEIFPKRGCFYTVRTADVEGDEQWLRLNEIVNPALEYEEGIGEAKFLSYGFRPVEERQTDISVFAEMLTKAPQELEREGV